MIYLASDHAGFELKNKILTHLKNSVFDVEDLGSYEYDENDDYPDFIKPLAKRVAKEKDSLGIIFGKSGG
ncbi:MAG: RpiB/LacA/LacB family sugar-phosphate isomerase, partial [Patescibacteria group bacterium]